MPYILKLFVALDIGRSYIHRRYDQKQYSITRLVVAPDFQRQWATYVMDTV